MNTNDFIDIINGDSSASTIRSDHTYLLSEGLLMLKPADNKDIISKIMSYGFWHWIPEYFFHTPASSTGKYHPAFANKENGLVLHTLAVMRNVNEFTTFMQFMLPETHNELIASALFHDMFKYGDPKTYKKGDYTDFEHPMFAANFFACFSDQMSPLIEDSYIEDTFKLSTADEIHKFRFETTTISRHIASHMGPFNTNKHSSVVLPVPGTYTEILLHKADLFASRKENDIVKDYL